MSEIVITTDFSKIPKNISKIKGSSLQTTGEKFSRKTDKFGDYLNKASKYSLDDDIGSIDKNSKNLLFSENIKSKAENNTDKTQNLSDDTDNKVDETKSVSDKDQLINNIAQELQKLIYLKNENNSTTLEKSDKNSIKSDGINSALNKLNYLLSDKVDTKTDLAQQVSNNQSKLSGMVEKQSTKETSAIEEILSELKSFDNINDISSKSSDLINSNAENINDDQLNNLIATKLSSKNFRNNVNNKTDKAQNVIKSNNNDDLLTNLISGKLDSQNFSNNFHNKVDRIQKLPNKVDNKADKTQNLFDDTDNKVDKTKSVSDKDQLINNIAQGLQKLIYLQNENNSTTLEKSDKNSIKSDGINSVLNKLNYLLSGKVDNKTDKTQNLFNDTDNKVDKTNVVSARDQLINDIAQELQNLISMQNINNNTTLEKSDKNSIESNGINSVLNKLNYLLSDKVDNKTDLAQQVSNNQDKLSGMVEKQSTKENSAIEEILSELKNFKNSNDINSKSSDLPNSNAENINDDLLNINNLISTKLDLENSKNNVNNKTDKSQNVIKSKNNDDYLLDNLISGKLDSQNFSYDLDNKVDRIQELSDKVDNKTDKTQNLFDDTDNKVDKTNVVSAKEQLINDIAQELQNLISMQNINNSTILEKSDKNSIKSDGINSVLNKLNYLLSDKMDIKADLAQQVSNNQDKLSDILGKQSTKETSAIEGILSELKNLENSNDISSKSSDLLNSNAENINDDLLNNLISTKLVLENFQNNVNNKTDKAQNDIKLNNNDDLLNNLISGKLDSQNFSYDLNNKVGRIQNPSDKLDNNTNKTVKKEILSDNELDKTNVVSAKEQLINDIEEKLQKLISLQNDNNSTTLLKSDQDSIKSDSINSVLNKLNYLLSDKVDTKTDLAQQVSNKQDKLSDMLGNQSTKEINGIKEILSEFKSLESSNEIISEKNSLSSAAKSVSNNQQQVLNKREVTILHNILSKLQDMYSNTNNSSTKLISTSNSLTKSKDNEFLNQLVDNKGSDDKYSKIINVMNQFTVNTADLNNQNQDIQPQVINKDNFTSDFIKSLNYMEDNNIKSMTVKIAPKELGEMLIKITSDGNIMKATITAANKDSYNLLNSNLHEINNSLNNQHIKIQSLDINIYNGDTTYFSDNSNFNNNQFSGNNGNDNRSNNETANLNSSNMEETDIKYENSNREENNVNVLV
ncbi:flagellar hook-length control protein FliK [Clostridium arbusti]|uniref:flagellar hook-length control protein FliK n=1 Tax=Clostridium arbusti TaxID=1137848 RepID=UPI000288FD19|nr:flagellar hook-length control protein FliK [Clostridium arbusti]